MKFDIFVSFEGPLYNIENIQCNFRPSKEGEYEIDPDKNILLLIEFYTPAFSYSDEISVKILKVGTFEDYEEFEKEAERIAKKGKKYESSSLSLVSSFCKIRKDFSEFY